MNKEFYGALVGGLMLGAGLGSLITAKLLMQKVDILVDAEVENIKKDYARYYSGYEKPDLHIVAETPVEEESKELTSAMKVALEARAASEAIMKEMGYTDEEVDIALEKEAEQAAVEENVFEKYGDVEEPEAETVPLEEIDHSRPYLISLDEFMEDDPFDTKITLTYFEEDDTLIEEKDETPVSIEDTVGSDALTRFGLNPQDKDTIHVRNEQLEVDFEITRDRRSYTEVILGMPSAKPFPKRWKEDD